MRTLLHPALLSCVLFAWSAAAEEATSYLSVEAATQELVRIEYFLTLDETCKPTLTPTINVLEKPKFGALLIKRGVLTAKKIVTCPASRTPVLLIYYRSRVGYAGSDHLVYSVKSRGGLATIRDVTISVIGRANKKTTRT
ncbi:MAG: hypothetical protein ACR65X_05185 [Methylocystis sp.]|jgi:hypothetical protein